jgi:CheY-like chemotaxis protein
MRTIGSEPRCVHFPPSHGSERRLVARYGKARSVRLAARSSFCRGTHVLCRTGEACCLATSRQSATRMIGPGALSPPLSQTGRGRSSKAAASRMQAPTDIMSGQLLDGEHPVDAEDDLDVRRLLTVVLAEDDGDLRSMLATLLRKDGYRVIEVGDGASLLKGMVRASFDGLAIGEQLLLITDARMPHADGLSVVRALKAQGRIPRFILMTAFGDPEVHAEARTLGALAVFDKPFDVDDLRRAVARLSRRLALH